MARTADVIVIGGGIAGIGAAARIAPDAQVIVLEREAAIGTHSTARSAAILVENYGNPTLRALTSASLSVLESRELSDIPLLTPRGEMAIAAEADLAGLEAFIAEGTGLDRLTPAEAVALCPILREDKIAGAALEANARDIDVDAMLQGYLRLLRAHGGVVETRCVISELSYRAHWTVETNQGAFEAPIVVNAAGAWADEVARLAGIRPVGLQPFRRSAAILPAPESKVVDGWPMIAAFDESFYFKPLSGKLMVSPSDEDPVEPHDAWPDDMVLAKGLDHFEQATTYALTRVERSWAGLRSFVADKSPVADFAPDAGVRP